MSAVIPRTDGTGKSLANRSTGRELDSHNVVRSFLSSTAKPKFLLAKGVHQ
jgi:hypothetical protein